MAPRQLATYKGIAQMHFKLSAPLLTAALTLLASLASPTVRADATLNFVDQANQTGQIQTSGQWVRVQQAAAGVFMLFNTSNEELTVVNSQAKSFQVITPDQIKQTASELDKAREQLKANFDKLPAAQQAQLKPILEQMRQSENAKRKVKAEGSNKVANIQCNEHQVFINDELSQQICSANQKSLGIAVKDYQNIAAMLNMLAEISRSFGTSEANAGVSPQELGGLPVFTNDPKTKNFNRLDSIDQKKIKASRFEVPSTYQQVRR